MPNDQVLVRSAASDNRSDIESEKRWPDGVRLSLPPTNLERVLNLEELPLPLENPYGPAIRAASVGFFADGRAARRPIRILDNRSRLDTLHFWFTRAIESANPRFIAGKLYDRACSL